MRLKAVTGYEYSGTFYEQPPLMSGLGGRLRETNSNLTHGGTNWDFG